MLRQTTFLLNITGGAGSYQADIAFQDSSRAKFLAPGDTVEDSVGNQYAVAASGWVGYPTDFGNIGTANLSNLGPDVAPSSIAFDSAVFTPNQVDKAPAIQTAGTIFSSSLIEGRTYTYQVSAGWSIGSQANVATTGDFILDAAGKPFRIVALSGQPGAFSSLFNVVEVEKIGDAPNSGPGYLFRGTPNFKFYQGEELSPAAESAIRNLDEFNTDAEILIAKMLPSGTGGGSSGASVTGVPTTTTSGVAYYEIQSGDYLILVQDSGSVTVVLPETPDVGRAVQIKDASPSNPDRTTNPISILPSGVDTIDGASLLQIVNTRQSFGLTYSNGDWVIL